MKNDAAFTPTEEQDFVINNLTDNILLNATAGTGKTQTLTARLLNILQSGAAKPEEVLNITFTNHACKEIRQRVTAASGEKNADADGLVVKTFHSWCLSVLRESYQRNCQQSAEFSIIDEVDAQMVRAEVMQSLRITCGDRDFETALDSVKHIRMREHLFSGDEEEDCRAAYGMCAFRNNAPLLNLVLAYEKYLRSINTLDFNDLVMRTYALFQDPTVVDFYSGKYKFINIDECQDTSVYEYAIVEKMFAKNRVLLSGDLFQSIYEWRNARAEAVFAHFTENFSPQVVTLTRNFRSSRGLVDCANRFLRRAFPDKCARYLSGKTTANSSENSDFEVFTEYDIQREAFEIGRRVERILSDNPKERVAVLVRTNNVAKLVSATLRSIPSSSCYYHLVDDYKFFRRVEIKDAMAFLKLVENPYDQHSLKRVLMNFGEEIGQTTLEHLLEIQEDKLGFRLTDFLFSSDGDYFGRLLDAYAKGAPIVVFDTETTGLDVSRDEIIQIGAVKLVRGEPVERFDKLLKISGKVGDSVGIHHISDEMLAESGEDKRAVLRSFSEFSEGTVIVGHNVEFDIRILQSEFERNGMSIPSWSAVYDTIFLYRRFYANMENYKLETICHYWNREQNNAHNALGDVLDTAFILNKIVEKIADTQEKRLSAIRPFVPKMKNFAEQLMLFVEMSKFQFPETVVRRAVEWFSIGGKEASKLERLEQLFSVLRNYCDDVGSPSEAMARAVSLVVLNNGELEELYTQRNGKSVIPVITVHQVKGLEFDTVFVAQCISGNFPCFDFTTNMAPDTEEERRLFYVAVTRAKRRLIISASNKKIVWSRRYAKEFVFDAEPSPYIQWLL